MMLYFAAFDLASINRVFLPPGLNEGLDCQLEGFRPLSGNVERDAGNPGQWAHSNPMPDGVRNLFSGEHAAGKGTCGGRLCEAPDQFYTLRLCEQARQIEG